MRWVPAVFVGSAALTCALTLLPWFVLLSPSLHSAQAARREANAPRVVEVKVPVPVPVVERVLIEPEPPAVVVAPLPPAPPATRRVEVQPPPKSAPVEPVPVSVEPSEPAPVPLPVVEPAPAPAQAPEPVAADAVRALSGRYAGTMGGKPLLIDLRFAGDGGFVATVQRGADEPFQASGRYAAAGERVTIAFVEPTDGGASYSGVVTPDGLSGRIALPNGKTQRFVAEP
jgi:hypothetical protein